MVLCLYLDRGVSEAFVFESQNFVCSKYSKCKEDSIFVRWLEYCDRLGEIKPTGKMADRTQHIQHSQTFLMLPVL